MTKQNETGHAKNVYNFETLTSCVTSYGADYNPSRHAIMHPQLLALLENGKSSINEINSAFSSYSTAIAAREEAFATLNKYTTRVLNALKASGSSTQIDESARSLVWKIQGVRASAKKTVKEKDTLKAEGKEVKEISSSQMSFDLRINNTEKLISLLAGIPEYAPNESELSVASLISYNNMLKEKNQEAVAATSQLNRARIFRDTVLYSQNTGLVDISVDVKSYVKSVYGATSPQYKQLAALNFQRGEDNQE
jgi:hypothetical protein